MRSLPRAVGSTLCAASLCLVGQAAGQDLRAETTSQSEVVPLPAPAVVSAPTAGATSVIATTAPIREAPRTPPLEKYENQPRWELVAIGTALFSAAYIGTCAGFGKEMCIPVVGPAIFMGRLIVERDEEERKATGDGIVPPAFVYAIFGAIGLGLVIIEGGSLALTVAGFAEPRKVPRKATTSVSVTPTLAPGLTGIGIVGSF